MEVEEAVSREAKSMSSWAEVVSLFSTGFCEAGEGARLTVMDSSEPSKSSSESCVDSIVFPAAAAAT